MFRTVQWGIAALVLGALGDVSLAQTILVPQGPLVAGDQIQVGYSNPAMAGKQVQIEVRGMGWDGDGPQTVTVTLGADGTGTTLWTVPEWDFASFNATGAEQQTRVIQGDM